MKKIFYIITLLSLFVTGLVAQSGRDIIQRVLDEQEVKSSAMDIQMTIIDKKGQKSVRRIQTLVLDDNGLTKTINLFLEPASVKNTRFLILENEGRDDDQWIYLPSLRKTKRIAAGEKDGQFMGSDFSYADMSSSVGSVDDSDITLLREEKFDGRDCYIVESIPNIGTDSNYGKYVMWVDKETWITLKTQFYSKNGETQIKELISRHIINENGKWYAKKVVMSTLIAGTSTELDIIKVKYNIPLNPSFFTTTFLETGRAR